MTIRDTILLMPNGLAILMVIVGGISFVTLLVVGDKNTKRAIALFVMFVVSAPAYLRLVFNIL